MKALRLVMVLMFCVVVAHAQNQVNYWMGGTNAMIKFENDSAYYQYRVDEARFWRTSASISDSLGNLLFYTNGFRVFNKNFEVMQNGDDLNVGDYESLGYDLLSTGDGAVIIPSPANSDQYYLFHQDLNLLNVPDGISYWPTNVFYCLIDMTLDSGSGAVVLGQKDVSIINDTLAQTGIKVARHGNGRDWWLLCHEYGSNRYFRFLVDPTGIQGPYEQSIGIDYMWVNAQVSSPMKFYNNDLSFAQSSRDSNIVELYDFDRCSGLLSNYRTFEVNDPWVPIRGISISPSDRFMYVSSNFNEVLQFDLNATDISSTRVVVGTDDGIGDPFAANYYYQELGRDGKIYVQGYDSNYSIHVINNPDSIGLACNFVQRGFKLDTTLFTTWQPVAVNVPNYALGALVGSGCDTLTSTNPLPEPVFSFGVYPNPFASTFQLTVTGVSANALVEVTDVLGRKVFSNSFTPVNSSVRQTINLSGCASGLYLVSVQVNDERYAKRLVKW